MQCTLIQRWSVVINLNTLFFSCSTHYFNFHLRVWSDNFTLNISAKPFAIRTMSIHFTSIQPLTIHWSVCQPVYFVFVFSILGGLHFSNKLGWNNFGYFFMLCIPTIIFLYEKTKFVNFVLKTALLTKTKLCLYYIIFDKNTHRHPSKHAYTIRCNCYNLKIWAEWTCCNTILNYTIQYGYL